VAKGPEPEVLLALLQIAAEELASSLLQAEPIVAYYRAKECFENDQEAVTLLDQLATAQADFRCKQSDGYFTQADIDHVRELDRLAQANQVIVEYVTTQKMATAHLADVNQEISRLLGIDFSTFASLGCC